MLDDAALAGVAGTQAITGFPLIWAQDIKNIELRHVGVSYSVVKAIGDQAWKDLGFKVTMQNLDTSAAINRFVTQPNTAFWPSALWKKCSAFPRSADDRGPAEPQKRAEGERAPTSVRGRTGRRLSMRQLHTLGGDRRSDRPLVETDELCNVMVTPMFDSARKAAAVATNAWRDGTPQGPLAGVPVTVKDLIFVAGVPARGGAPALENFVPEVDAAVVTSLREAGEPGAR